MLDTETMQYQIIFCDIDGTLLDSKNRISAGTKQKLRVLCQNGIPFIMVSARMPSGIFPLQQELGIKMPIICYSGALTLDEHGNCIRAVGLDREKAILIDAYIKKEWNRVCCSAFCHNDWIVDHLQDPWVVQEQQITSSVPSEGRIADFVPPGGQIHKLLCMGDAEQITALNEALKENYPALSIHRSKATYLEIMDGAATKSGAIGCLCKDYGISVRTAVSFGDSYNDMDMLCATGISFAMGNASEEVKRQARYITADNDHEGVLAGLRQLNFAENRK